MNIREILLGYRLPLADLVADEKPFDFGDAGLEVETNIERRGDAVVIRHRLHNRLRVLFIAGEVTVHPHPVHLPAPRNLILADNRDVVFRLTGEQTGVAARAGVQIDRHAPLVLAVEPRVLVERFERRVMNGVLGKLRLFPIVLERRLAH